MFKVTAKCSVCDKEIHAYEEIYVKMRYPKSRGMTEVKAFLQNEGKIICEKCFNKMKLYSPGDRNP
ncbi:Fe3+ hydroxamate ABC transporter substrate-binding protein [Niallia sp. 01092]|uniref:Fe3+ hydroxamate ABC transporter substrate-binding protein n=1 Tax=unclassified Niallia TaxID=2837522 RepID=UPI003FD3E35E